MEECNEEDNIDTRRQLSLYLTQAFLFMNKYEWISNSYVAEFFTQQLWMKLPCSWRKCLENSSLEEVAISALHDSEKKRYSNVWPLSLLSFVATCHSLALDRKQKKVTCDHGSSPEMSNIFKKHIKPKKRHELSVLPEVIHDICERTGSKNIVDVGSGLGHLSRFLAFKYGYNVTAIEMTSQRLPVAKRFDKQMENELEHLKRNGGCDLNDLGKVTHVAKRIDSDITSEEFCTLINDTKSSSDNSKCILIGLHTCGDLASTMLRVFKNTPMISGVVSVSCCYFKMTLEDVMMPFGLCNSNISGDSTIKQRCINSEVQELFNDFCLMSLKSLTGKLKTHRVNNYKCTGMNGNNDSLINECKGCGNIPFRNPSNYGFPLSSFLRNIPCQPMKYKSFETACHFIDDYAEKLRNSSPNLKLHCYRAVMEILLRKVDPKLVLTAIRCKKIKNAASMSFSEYAEKVFERLGKPFKSQMLNMIDCDYLLSQWKNVAIYHSFALLLGPVIESIALVDKWMYLLEAGFNVDLLPLFDPKISPRNFVTVGTRKQNKVKVLQDTI